MSKNSDEEWTQEEAKEWFKKKIDSVKELRIIAETRYKTIPKHDERSYMNAKWSWTLAEMMYSELEDMWELLENIVLTLYETEVETTSLKEGLKKLGKELREYRPTLRGFKQALDRTQEIMKNGR